MTEGGSSCYSCTVRKIPIYSIFCALAAGFIGGPAGATELMSPATQLGERKVHAEVYYRHIARQDLRISLGSVGSASVNGSTVSTASSSEADFEGSGSGVMAKITFQPFENSLRYYIVGGLSDYNLKVPSGTFSNTFATDNPGTVIGGGLKYTLVPYTMVSPALSLDLSAVHSRYKLTKFNSGDRRVVGDTGFLLTTLELQGALTLSKKFLFDLGDNKASIDPYLGVKVMRLRTGLDDLSTGAHYSGTMTAYAPFFGFKFKPFPYQGLVVEGSVLNELSASIGLTLGF